MSGNPAADLHYTTGH